MRLEKYIADLLYRHQCVTVPGFGAFITEEVSATYNPKSQTFVPPSKLVYLNTLLKSNDGLLAQYIAKEQQISYPEAVAYIGETVSQWNSSLAQKSPIELSGLGTLFHNQEGNISFEAYGIQNYLTSSFGLSPVMATSLQQVQEPKVVAIQTRKTGYRRYLQTAAAVLIGAGAWLGYSNYQEFTYFESQKNAVTQSVNEQVQQQLQKATFFIEPPQIKFETEQNQPNHYLIAGAFRTEKGALRLVQELKDKGFENASFLPKNKYNLYPVAYTSYTDENMAKDKLKEVQKSDNREAWILTQDNE